MTFFRRPKLGLHSGAGRDLPMPIKANVLTEDKFVRLELVMKEGRERGLKKMDPHKLQINGE